MKNSLRKLYFCAMENTIDNNIHASQVYPVIKKTPNMKGLFLNPFFEVSRSRIGLIKLDKKCDSNIKISRIPLATYFFFSPWYFFPIVFIILFIYLFTHCLFNRYEIIHCRHTLSGFVAIPIAKIFRIKVISDIRGCYTDEGVLLGRWKDGSLSFHFYKKLERFVYKHSQAVTGISPVMCSYIKSISPSTNPIYIPAIVDTERIFYDEKIIDNARNELNISEDDLCFIYVGSIGAWNSVDELINQLNSAVNNMRIDRKKIHLIVLSKDSRFIDGLKKLPYRIYTNSVNPNEVNYYLNASDYGLLPGKKITSDSEKKVFEVMISSKAEEYLCSGLKVISNDGIKYFQNLNQLNIFENHRSDISSSFKNEFSLEKVLSSYASIYDNLR